MDSPIKCTFGYSKWKGAAGKLKWVYSCIVTGTATITERYTTLKSIKGVHLKNENDNTVKAVLFEKCKLKYFPRGLSKIFPSITCLSIEDCGLEEITRRDLKDLSNLTHLKLNKNLLSSLPNELFTEVDKLRVISFQSNQIETLSYKLFYPILKNHLIWVDFRWNLHINSLFECFYVNGEGNLNPNQVANTVYDMMRAIEGNCFPLENVDEKDEWSKEAWHTGLSSDRVVKAQGIEQSVEFKVHRMHLSSISSELVTDIESGSDIPYSSNIVREFLKFCYLKEDPSPKNAMAVFKMARSYKIEALMSSCLKVLKNNLNKANALEVYHFSSYYMLDDLKSEAFKALKVLYADIFISDELINNPEKLTEVIRWQKSILSPEEQIVFFLIDDADEVEFEYEDEV